MITEISLNLRNKIRLYMTITNSHIYTPLFYYIGYIPIVFPDDIKIYNECVEWKKIIEKNKQHNKYYILDKVGRFHGIRPLWIYKSGIDFEVESFESEESWKDWFDITGENDGSLIDNIEKIVK